MAEVVASYKKTLPPHIRSKDSLSKRFWGQLIALAPIFIAACLTRHAEILRILLICLVSAVAFEFLAAKLFKKKENLQSGETVLSAALFALLLPSKCPAEIVILGVFVAVFVARELFGGTGSYLLHPALVARVFLQISFPGIMAEPLVLAGDGHLGILVGIGLGGILFLRQRQGYWETPLLFMAVCFLWETVFGGNGAPVAFFSVVLFTAFFLLADPVTMPLTRKGTRFFVLGAALLSASLGGEGFSIGTAAYAILLMDLLAPWLDVGLRPVPYKSKNKIKATYSL
jgi:electron transport complex protein RnfD